MEELKQSLSVRQSALDKALKVEVATLRRETESALSHLQQSLAKERSKEAINCDLTEWLSAHLKARTISSITEGSSLVADWSHVAHAFVSQSFLPTEAVYDLVDFFAQKWVH